MNLIETLGKLYAAADKTASATAAAWAEANDYADPYLSDTAGTLAAANLTSALGDAIDAVERMDSATLAALAEAIR